MFDLGGVIVPWVGLEALAAHTNRSRESVAQQFQTNAIFRAYEVGACTDASFLEELQRVFSLSGDPSELSALWQGWVKAPFPGTEVALSTLKDEFRVACLSNTNALHWAYLKTLLDIDHYFEPALASHLLQAAKPDKNVFTETIERIGLEASEIWFFDDTPENVQAAQAFGITAYEVDRSVGVIPTLIKLGLLRP